MTEDDIRAVFGELRRLGVDLGAPPGLALGTGFRNGQFLTWLRSLPDGLGHGEFVRAVDAQVTAAQPNAWALVPHRRDGGPHREWPTVEQLRAAIDVLCREWDPLGARLGDLTTEDVMPIATNALGYVLALNDPERVELAVADKLAEAELEVFGVRASPSEQRRYLARRLIQVVVDDPGAGHEEDAWEEMHRATQASMEIARAEGRVKETRSGVTVCFGPRGDELPALDANATCTECDTVGTVAVVGREVEPFVLRFCPACWTGVREQYMGRFWHPHPKHEEATTPEELIARLERQRDEMLFHARARTRYTASAMWEDQLPFIEASMRPSEGQSPADRERYLQHLAEDVHARAPTMYGPMLPEIEAFVKEYLPRSQPSSPSDQRQAAPSDRNQQQAPDPDA
jgi:hypothetical protein